MPEPIDHAADLDAVAENQRLGKRQSETRITDEMVERAARAMFDIEPREHLDADGTRLIRRPWAHAKDIYLERARAALVAALEGERDTPPF